MFMTYSIIAPGTTKTDKTALSWRSIYSKLIFYAYGCHYCQLSDIYQYYSCDNIPETETYSHTGGQFTASGFKPSIGLLCLSAGSS